MQEPVLLVEKNTGFLPPSRSRHEYSTLHLWLRCLQVMLLVAQMLTALGEDFCRVLLCAWKGWKMRQLWIVVEEQFQTLVLCVKSRSASLLWKEYIYRERWALENKQVSWHVWNPPPLSRVSGSPWLPSIWLNRMKLFFAGRRRRIQTLMGSASGLQHCQPVDSCFV